MMRALFTISLVELFMGGGGRLIAAGPVSLRMVLFALCLCATLVAFLFPRRRSEGVLLAMGLILVYLIIHVGALLVGAIYSGDTSKMFIEFQQSLYWLAAPFFALMVQSEEDVRKGARLVLYCGTALALIYICILIGLLTGIIHLVLLRNLLGETGEFQFRSGEFFIYKGFLYLGIAIVFLVALRVRFWIPLLLLVSAALILTFTRGFLVSTSVAVLLMLFAQRRWRAAVPALILVATGVFVVWIYLPSTDDTVGGHYETSSNQRLEDMGYIASNISPKTFLVGEGYASLINNRYAIENTFLWALWKLGTVGVLFWLLPIALCLHYYLKIPNRESNEIASAFLFGVVLVYVQTGTNPFLNNPIGLSYTLLAMFSLRLLSRQAHATAHTQVGS
jgi:hypothetical protein